MAKKTEMTSEEILEIAGRIERMKRELSEKEKIIRQMLERMKGV